jgi:hypothetical protein
LIRDGLFLIVCTPSGVRVESMMYVAKPYPPVLVDARAPLYPIRRRLRRLVGAGACLAVVLSGSSAASTSAAAASAGPLATAAQGGTGTEILTDRGCYLVGQTVQLSGSGFEPGRTFVVSIDGVYLGQRTTDSAGSFSVPLHPGGLPAGAAQHLDSLQVTDGTMSAETSFMLTRPAGALITNTAGGPGSLTGRFLVWGFSLGGAARPIYVHYVSPSGKVRKTVSLGPTRGQCGYRRTARRRVFPFSVTRGTWTLQVDTRPSYSRKTPGPRVRIRVVIR